jgi:hypothetical protein
MKVQCSNILRGENVHKHYCDRCKGRQHVSLLEDLEYKLGGLLVLTSYPPYEDADDDEMHSRIQRYIDYHKSLHGYDRVVTFERIYRGEPISTLHACIATLRLFKPL